MNYDLTTIAERIGLVPQGRGAWSPCPVCGATHRGSEERRGPISFFKNNQAWKCHAGGCGAGGDAITLYAAQIYGRIPASSEKELWAKIFAELENRDTPTLQIHRPDRSIPPASSDDPPQKYPPVREVQALWDACLPLSKADTNDPALAYLRLRGLDPARMGDLARLLPIQHPWPSWVPASYRKQHRLVIPVFDATGTMRGLRFRADSKLLKKKALPPVGFPCSGLVLADPQARALFRGEPSDVPWDGRVIVVEGEPDFWTWSARKAREQQIHQKGNNYAVIGIVSGSWTQEISDKIPNETVILLRTHQDTKGIEYADKIQKTLETRCTVKRPSRAAYGDIEPPPDENDRLLNKNLPIDPETETVDIKTPQKRTAQQKIATLPWIRPAGVWLDAKPLPRPYLLHLPSNPGSLSMRGDGMIPLGKVGILAAAGGVGKTFALCGLALAIVTGKPWFGYFPVGSDLQRRVVLVLGEEDEPELRRRLYQQATAMIGENEPEREHARQAISRILALPGAGLDTLALTQTEENGRMARTEFADAFFDFLEDEGKKNGGWDAVILDPLARFAGPDVETDNAAATRMIQILERLTKLPGGPAVIVAHHTNKASRNAENTIQSSASVRGSSALVDGARWVASLEELFLPGGERFPGATRFRVTKSNYGRIPEDELTLIRTGEGGLRVASRHEHAELNRLLKQRKQQKEPPVVSGATDTHFRKGDA